MPTTNTNRLIEQLEDLKTQFSPANARKTLSLLERFSRQEFQDPESLIRFHELLLFLRAYPQNASIVRTTETQLRTFSNRISLLREQDTDLSNLEHPEMSGIAGTSVIDTFSFHIVRWLLQRHSTQVALDWQWFEDENRLAETWPRFMPLLEEDAFVEANVPYREWLCAARSSHSEMAWVLERFDKLLRSDKEKSELYDSQKLYVRWTPQYRFTRTGMRLPLKRLFYHRGPLIQRRDVRFTEELTKPSPPVRRLSVSEGEKALDLAREASTIRYRELYGFTHGDPKLVYKAQLGRGAELLLVSLPTHKRMPLRAYHAAMIYKNGVPIGYFEGLSLFERMESGFNLYYTFRDGETAWLYARTLNVMRHFAGVSAFSLDPYQIGYENEEGIESGAFWFYHKLGFRPTSSALLRLAEKEEEKIATRERYRTSAATLRKLAEGPMILELDRKQVGDWNGFQMRNIGFAVQRRIASKFGGEARRMRESAVKFVEQALDVNTGSLSQTQRSVFSDFAVVLLLMSDLKRWSAEEKQTLFKIIRAKASDNETRYLKLMRRHARLRKAMLRLGS